LFLWAGVLGTVIWLIWGGAAHFNAALAFTYPAGAWNFSWLFFAGLGAATVKTVYTYLGYYNVCHLGGEVRDPERTIPRSIFLSIGGIALLYLLLQTVILGVVPWQEAQRSEFIVSVFVERLYGAGWARVATAMILWVAFGSLFSLSLGYSRVPYAAALDGNFFSVFGRVHPTKRFPHVSLLALGATAFVFSLLFRLSEVISAILAMRILVQFVAGAIGLMVLRSRWPAERFPFKMWLYPIPAILAIVGWLAIFFSTGYVVLWGTRVYLTVAAVGIMILGTVVFLLRARFLHQWPFEQAAQ